MDINPGESIDATFALIPDGHAIGDTFAVGTESHERLGAALMGDAPLINDGATAPPAPSCPLAPGEALIVFLATVTPGMLTPGKPPAHGTEASVGVSDIGAEANVRLAPSNDPGEDPKSAPTFAGADVVPMTAFEIGPASDGVDPMPIDPMEPAMEPRPASDADELPPVFDPPSPSSPPAPPPISKCVRP